MARRAEGRVQMNLAQCRRAQVQHLLVSDENFAGTMRECIRTKTLYPAIGDRLSRIGTAFGQDVSRIVLSVRALDLWWASAAAFTVARGHPVPNALAFEMMAHGPRSWRDVITDISCAVPQAQIIITPFEQFAGQPEAVFGLATGRAAPANTSHHWRNRTPHLPALRQILAEQESPSDILPDGSGRWQPFTPAQAAALRETYADDMHWLIAGADGLATLATDPTRTRTTQKGAGSPLHAGILTEGTSHDSRQENLARSG